MVYGKEELLCKVVVFRLLLCDSRCVEVLCDIRFDGFYECLVVVYILVKLIIGDECEHACNDSFNRKIFLFQVLPAFLKLDGKSYRRVDFE